MMRKSNNSNKSRLYAKNGIYKLPNFKIYKSGPIVEVYWYKGRYIMPRDSGRDFAVFRAKTNLRRLISANSGQWFDEHKQRFFNPQFYTLTYAKNEVDVCKASNDFKLFIKRFNYDVFNSKKAVLKYSVVIEFQKRGAIHYHLLLYNMPFIWGIHKRITELWGYGFVWLRNVSSVGDVGSYMVKYMAKDMTNLKLPKGFRLYNNARKLIKPEIVVNDEEAELFLNSLNSKNCMYAVNRETTVYERYYVPVGSVPVIDVVRAEEQRLKFG